jgi:hypothetical protein
VSESWLYRYETQGLNAASGGRLSVIVTTLEKAGVEFTDGSKPGVRLRNAE